MRLDSRQRFWKYDSAQYPWMTEKVADQSPIILSADGWVDLRAEGVERGVAELARHPIHFPFAPKAWAC
jgi:hypothetical protein